MAQATIAGVLLDIDDTLVDTRGAFRHALATVAEDYLPGAPNPDDLVALWRTDASGWYRSYTRGELDYREQRMRRANELHEAFGGPHMDDEAYDAWDARFEQGFRDGWRAHDDALPFLAELDRLGIAYGAVSNAGSEYQAMKLARTGLAAVPMLVGVDTFGVGKPDPRVFREGARLLGLDPAQVAYVGDERDIDAHAAVEAGLGAGVWIDRFDAPPGDLAAGVHRVEALAEVCRALSIAR